MVFAETVTLDQWKAEVARLKLVKDAYKRCLGDALVFGRRKFGEVVVANYCEQLEFPFVDVTQAIALGEVEREERKALTNLQPGHYTIARNLCPDVEERTEWLRTANEHELSKDELKASIKIGRVTKAPKPGPSIQIQTIQGIMFSFNQWLSSVRGSMNSWEEKDVKNLLALISPVVKLSEELEKELRHDHRTTTAIATSTRSTRD